MRFMENGRPEAEVMRKMICRPDVLILATGYTQSFHFLDGSYPKLQDATIRSVWNEHDESVAFIGFVRPSFGKNPGFYYGLLFKLTMNRSYSTTRRIAGSALGSEFAQALTEQVEV